MSDNDQKTVLLVDDAPANIKVLNTALKETYRTKVATSGEKALEIAARDPKPDLILLDIMMPGMDGFEVCEKLKADPETKDIPVIFLSGKNNPGDRSRGLALGAIDFLEKPIDVTMVCIWVTEHLNSIQPQAD
ncbi:response regulator [Marinobacterium mangrovicola]|uniref:Putative two-component system response regulator n=1 Tax=Marinobacterium mangrovicola TaxID=1476959 RepID=A0A4R1GP81_9GAMM|nr:response regulator [Marinobacterium mangrovicola]TCK09113.1 putative two-component system response regulator [Marinobacterium mangrovicola]